MERHKRRGIRKRRAEKRKQKIRKLFFAAVLVPFILLAVFAIIFFQKRQNKKLLRLEDAKKQETLKQEQLEKGKQEVEELYQSYLAEREEAVPAAVEEIQSFSDWFFETYLEKAKKEVLELAADGKLTKESVYHAAGESMHVAYDRYKGYLNDVETAKQYGIYERDGKKEEQAEVTIAGDLCFAEDGFVLDHYDEVNDLAQCISPKLLEITNASDIFYVNHEYAISDRGAPLAGKYYTFRAHPKRMELLKEMGTDLVALSNNHVYDYGEDAFQDTMKLLKQADIPYVGGGANLEEAKRPVYFIVNGIKIGFVGASNAEKIRYTPQAGEDSSGILLAYDTTAYNQVISDAAKQCDYLIAYIHWGTEDTNDFNDVQQQMGREFLNSGADIVVGGHPHVLQGMEYVDGKPIVYSLGDFWFNGETKYTGLLKLQIDIDGLREMSFVPALQTGYTTQYLDAEEEQMELFGFLENLSPNVEIDQTGVIREK